MFRAPHHWLIRNVVLCATLFFSTHCYPLATSSDLLGIWEAGDRAHQAIYGRFKISKRVIQFSLVGRRWKCATPYEIVETGDANSYRAASVPFPAEVKSWHFFNLRLSKSNCTSATNFVFAFMDDSPDFVAFVEFRNTSEWAGTGHFHRVATNR
jgi:hypothetical protein